MDAGTKSKIAERIEVLSSLLKAGDDAAASSSGGLVAASEDSTSWSRSGGTSGNSLGTSRAIEAVRSVRSRMVAEEHRRNFSPYPRSGAGSSSSGKRRPPAATGIAKSLLLP